MKPFPKKTDLKSEGATLNGGGKMKKTRISRLFILLLAIILEILPYGAVCIFATPEETFRKTFSYFSLVPYGYANFAPFITALLTCILLVLLLSSLVSKRDVLEGWSRGISLVAAIISLCPLFLGVQFFSFVGAAISVLLWSVAILSFWGRCENEK